MKGGQETLFVKNLENVQGDERDVIFISTTFHRAGAAGVRPAGAPVAAVATLLAVGAVGATWANVARRAAASLRNGGFLPPSWH